MKPSSLCGVLLVLLLVLQLSLARRHPYKKHRSSLKRNRKAHANVYYRSRPFPPLTQPLTLTTHQQDLDKRAQLSNIVSTVSLWCSHVRDDLTPYLSAVRVPPNRPQTHPSGLITPTALLFTCAVRPGWLNRQAKQMEHEINMVKRSDQNTGADMWRPFAVSAVSEVACKSLNIPALKTFCVETSPKVIKKLRAQKEIKVGHGLCRYGGRYDCCYGWVRNEYGDCKLSTTYTYDPRSHTSRFMSVDAKKSSRKCLVRIDASMTENMTISHRNICLEIERTPGAGTQTQVKFRELVLEVCQSVNSDDNLEPDQTAENEGLLEQENRLYQGRRCQVRFKVRRKENTWKHMEKLDVHKSSCAGLRADLGTENLALSGSGAGPPPLPAVTAGTLRQTQPPLVPDPSRKDQITLTEHIWSMDLA
ncbi:positive regulation of cell-substrate adhesion, partial [Branchiostoma belcheri]